MLQLLFGVAATCLQPTFALNGTASSGLPTFDSFIELHARGYQKGSADYEHRRALYEKRLAEVQRQNQLKARWLAGVNKLSDWTEDELQNLRGWNGDVRPLHTGSRSVRIRSNFLQRQTDETELPNEKLWTDLETAKHIHNQGGCGSCWAMAVSSVLEFHTEIHRNERRTFSAQQIVSCTPNPRECGGTGRCGGATAELAFDYVLKHGCAEASQVPYIAQDGTCAQPELSTSFLTDNFVGGQSMVQADESRTGASFGMTGWETLPKNEVQPLMRALVERGPVAVSVAASDWTSYESGVFDGCSKDAIVDHAVVLVGYGQSGSDLTWVIQNSWGSDWGEGGHIRLLRHDNSDAYCGIDDKPQDGIACKGDNAPVRVCGMCAVLFDSALPHIS
jgi:cathepsin L